MNIYITYGVGEGPTKLAAFDSALFNAGIANFNLIYLSSIIPPNSKIIQRKLTWNEKSFGNKLYVVISHLEFGKLSKSAYVGLGWIYDKKIGGIFAEHNSSSRKKLIFKLENTLGSMAKNRSIKNKPIMKVLRIDCKKLPKCGLIVAVYKDENWI